ncbi:MULTISPECIES: hypothetical protein [unclassified Micromonospora]|uniref:hypothetical protein n=1 Tax=unclassified Micromonospora TaxID=2617518 RepID=UPI001033044E|nr:hypothetical protein [Verrucosispora sp. SN26_14.1]TBL34390.1 hypothetical protein EYA84_15610 [Verrucosispora sp. SN26_14.1]
MERKYGVLIAVVASTASLAIVGSLAGYYLADRGSPTVEAGSDRSPENATDRDRTPARDADDAPQTPVGTDRQTYRLDRQIYQESSFRLTLTGAETSDGTLRLTFRYRNDSPLPWPLVCPSREDDLNSSALTLADGRTVRPTDTWCAAERAGEAVTVAPGQSTDTWGVFPVSPSPTEPFSVSWYDFPVLTDVRLG